MIVELVFIFLLFFSSLGNKIYLFNSKHNNHFLQTTTGISVTNVADSISRVMQIGIFNKDFEPNFLSFLSSAPEANIFVYVPGFSDTNTEKFLSGAHSTIQVEGDAGISAIMRGSLDTGEQDTLIDLMNAKFDGSLTCASRLTDMAQSLCDGHDTLVWENSNKPEKPTFLLENNLFEQLPIEFLNELQLLIDVCERSLSSKNVRIIVFGISTYQLVPSHLRAAANSVLESAINLVLNKMEGKYSNSIMEVLTMNKIETYISNRRRLQTSANFEGKTPGEWLARIWVSVSGLVIIIAISYYLAFMDYTQDSVLYTTMNPNWTDFKR